MTRLNSRNRAKIINAAVEHSGINREREKLRLGMQQLAERVRVAALGGRASAKRIDALRSQYAGLIKTHDHIETRINGERHYLYFNGRNALRRCHPSAGEIVTRPCVAHHCLPEDDALARDLRRLLAAKEALDEREQATRDATRALVESVGSVKRLLSVWPEVAAILPADLSESSDTLPAVPIEQVNALVGLP